MSFNSSVQQLGTFAASLIAGFVVTNGPNNEIYRYSWLGYLSVVVLLVCLFIGLKIFSTKHERTLASASTESAIASIGTPDTAGAPAHSTVNSGTQN